MFDSNTSVTPSGAKYGPMLEALADGAAHLLQVTMA